MRLIYDEQSFKQSRGLKLIEQAGEFDELDYRSVCSISQLHHFLESAVKTYTSTSRNMNERSAGIEQYYNVWPRLVTTTTQACCTLSLSPDICDRTHCNISLIARAWFAVREELLNTSDNI